MRARWRKGCGMEGNGMMQHCGRAACESEGGLPERGTKRRLAVREDFDTNEKHKKSKSDTVPTEAAGSPKYGQWLDLRWLNEIE